MCSPSIHACACQRASTGSFTCKCENNGQATTPLTTPSQMTTSFSYCAMVWVCALADTKMDVSSSSLPKLVQNHSCINVATPARSQMTGTPATNFREHLKHGSNHANGSTRAKSVFTKRLTTIRCLQDACVCTVTLALLSSITQAHMPPTEWTVCATVLRWAPLQRHHPGSLSSQQEHPQWS